MTTGELSELKASLARLNEQAKMILGRLDGILRDTAEMAEALAALERRLGEMEKKNGVAPIYDGLVARRMITREEADVALEKMPA